MAMNADEKGEMNVERITFDGNFCDIAMCKEIPCKDGACDQKKTWERLKFIEDILGDDYDLDRLRDLVKADREGRYIIMRYAEREGVDRLRELAEADREGRCVVMPCKAGDIVYSMFPFCGVNSHEIRRIEISKEGCFACSALMIPFSDFGKTVFPTREAAEEALKERENNG